MSHLSCKWGNTTAALRLGRVERGSKALPGPRPASQRPTASWPWLGWGIGGVCRGAGRRPWGPSSGSPSTRSIQIGGRLPGRGKLQVEVASSSHCPVCRFGPGPDSPWARNSVHIPQQLKGLLSPHGKNKRQRQLCVSSQAPQEAWKEKLLSPRGQPP